MAFKHFFTEYSFNVKNLYDQSLKDTDSSLWGRHINNREMHTNLQEDEEQFIDVSKYIFLPDIIRSKPKAIKGSSSFEEAYKKAVQINPSVAKYKDFLTRTAKRESNFNSYIQNTAGAPYYGYFQMGEQEIKKTTGLTVEQFRNDPVAQILGAAKLYEMNLATVKQLKAFDGKDSIKVYELCKQKGYSDDAIVAGAWAGGPGGVKKFITGKGNPSDSHWYGGQGGTSVGKLMNEFKNYG